MLPYYSMLRSYGGMRTDYLTAIALTVDDWGTVLVGYDIGISAAEYDGYVTKLDKCGDVIWTSNYGGALADSISAISIASDGSFVFVGQWTSPSTLKTEVMLVQVSPLTGMVRKGASFSIINDRAVTSNGMIFNPDGTALIVGTTTTSSRTRALIMLVDLKGIIAWSYALGGDTLGHSYFFIGTTRLNSGDYVAVGYGREGENVIGITARVSANGEGYFVAQWGRVKYDIAYSVASCRDGGYVIAASSQDTTPSESVQVLRMTALNELSWAVSISGTGRDIPSKIIVTRDDGFLVVGSTTSNAAGTAVSSAQGFLFKLDSSGQMQWARTYGKGSFYKDVFVDVFELPGGGYRVGGHGYTIRASGSSDAFVIQLSSNGDMSDIILGSYLTDAATVFSSQRVRIELSKFSVPFRYVDGVGGDITSVLTKIASPRQQKGFTSGNCESFAYSSWPTEDPTTSPSSSPPTLSPTTSNPTSSQPSVQPSSSNPTSSCPTTSAPSHSPSTTMPTTTEPTQNPTAPTKKPTPLPSILAGNPTPPPTLIPTLNPSEAPTRSPTGRPSFGPSAKPTLIPSTHPTSNPTPHVPTRLPTKVPTPTPTTAPSHMPSRRPSRRPTADPTHLPTPRPTVAPIVATLAPSADDGVFLTGEPTPQPTETAQSRSAGPDGMKARIGYAIILAAAVICLFYFVRSLMRWYLNDGDFTFSEMCATGFVYTYEYIFETYYKRKPDKLAVGAVLMECVDSETGLSQMVYLAPVNGSNLFRDEVGLQSDVQTNISTLLQNVASDTIPKLIDPSVALSESAPIVDRIVDRDIEEIMQAIKVTGAKVILSDIDDSDDSINNSDSADSNSHAYVETANTKLVSEKHPVVLANLEFDHSDDSSTACTINQSVVERCRSRSYSDDIWPQSRSRVYSADDDNSETEKISSGRRKLGHGMGVGIFEIISSDSSGDSSDSDN